MIEKGLRQHDFIPGTERYTRPEEIQALGKFLKKIKETQEEHTEVVENNLELPDSKDNPILHSLDSLPTQRVNIRGGIDEVKELVPTRIDLKGGGREDVKLDETREELKVNSNPTLEDKKITLEDNLENELETSKITLHGPEDRDLVEEKVILEGNKDPENLEDGKVYLEHTEDNQITELSTGSLQIETPEINDLKGTQSKLNVELPDPESTLGKITELPGENEYRSEIPGETKNISDLEKGKITIEDNHSESLEDTVLKIKREETKGLEDHKEKIRKGNDKSLEKGQEKLKGDLKDPKSLESHKEEIKKPQDKSLDTTLETITPDQTPDLDGTKLSISPKEISTLEDTKEEIKDTRVQTLEDTKLEITPEDPKSLESHKEEIKKPQDKELEGEKIRIEKKSDPALGKKKIEITGNEDHILEDKKLEITPKEVSELGEDSLKITSDQDKELEKGKVEISKPQDQELVKDNIKIEKTPDLPLETGNIKLEGHQDHDLDKSRLELEDTRTPWIYDKDTKEILEGPKDVPLEDSSTLLEGTKDVELSGGSIKLEGPKDHDLETKSTKLEGPKEVTKLEDKSEKIKAPVDPSLVDKRLDITAPKDQPLEDHKELLKGAPVDVDLKGDETKFELTGTQDLVNSLPSADDAKPSSLPGSTTVNPNDIPLEDTRLDIGPISDHDLEDKRLDISPGDDNKLEDTRLDINVGGTEGSNFSDSLEDMILELEGPEDHDLEDKRLDISIGEVQTGKDSNFADDLDTTRIDLTPPPEEVERLGGEETVEKGPENADLGERTITREDYEIKTGDSLEDAILELSPVENYEEGQSNSNFNDSLDDTILILSPIKDYVEGQDNSNFKDDLEYKRIERQDNADLEGRTLTREDYKIKDSDPLEDTILELSPIKDYVEGQDNSNFKDKLGKGAIKRQDNSDVSGRTVTQKDYKILDSEEFEDLDSEYGEPNTIEGLENTDTDLRSTREGYKHEGDKINNSKATKIDELKGYGEDGRIERQDNSDKTDRTILDLDKTIKDPEYVIKEVSSKESSVITRPENSSHTDRTQTKLDVTTTGWDWNGSETTESMTPAELHEYQKKNEAAKRKNIYLGDKESQKDVISDITYTKSDYSHRSINEEGNETESIIEIEGYGEGDKKERPDNADTGDRTVTQKGYRYNKEGEDTDLLGDMKSPETLYNYQQKKREDYHGGLEIERDQETDITKTKSDYSHRNFKSESEEATKIDELKGYGEDGRVGDRSTGDKTFYDSKKVKGTIKEPGKITVDKETKLTYEANSKDTRLRVKRPENAGIGDRRIDDLDSQVKDPEYEIKEVSSKESKRVKRPDNAPNIEEERTITKSGYKPKDEGEIEIYDKKETVERDSTEKGRKIPRYKLPEIGWGNFWDGNALNPSTYLRWAVENTVGHLPLRGSSKSKIIDETLALLVLAREKMEKAAKGNRDRLPGGDLGLISDLASGKLNVKSASQKALSAVGSALSRKVDHDNPINRPKNSRDGQEEWNAPGQVIEDWQNLDRNGAESGKSKGVWQKLKNGILGGQNSTGEAKETRVFKTDYLGPSQQVTNPNGLGDYSQGMFRTIQDLTKNQTFTTLSDFKEAIRSSRFFTTPEKFTSTKNSTNYMTLDSNHVWEIFFRPYIGNLNGYKTWLPSFLEIDKRNKKAFNFTTKFGNGWLPITGFTLQDKKLTSKDIPLHNGSFSVPIGMEFTNELRIIFADDSLKSLRRYFELCTKVSAYMSNIHYSSEPGYFSDTSKSSGSANGTSKISSELSSISKAKRLNKILGGDVSTFDKRITEDITGNLNSQEYELKKMKEAQELAIKNREKTDPVNNPTVYLEGKIHPGLYKNLSFLVTIFVMTPQLATIKKCDLLCVLKDFSIEDQGETDSSPTELEITFSIVGENPKIEVPLSNFSEYLVPPKTGLKDRTENEVGLGDNILSNLGSTINVF